MEGVGQGVALGESEDEGSGEGVAASGGVDGPVDPGR